MRTLLATLLLLWAQPLAAQVKILDPALQPALDSLLAASPRLREAVTQVRVPVYISSTTRDGALLARYGVVLEQAHAGVTVLFHHGDTMDNVLVLVDPGFSGQLQRTLVHELWGHALPPATSGRYQAHCEDPAPGKSYVDSCVGRRENALLRELGLAPRLAYGVAD